MIEALQDRRPARPETEPHSLQTEHALLRLRAERLQGLLQALADGAPERATGARSYEVRLLAKDFRRLLFDHLAAEERDGVLEHAAGVEPRFARRVEELQLQHVELRDRMEVIVSHLVGTANGGAADWNWIPLLRAFVAFREVLLEHDRSENEVLISTYLDDLGGRG